MTSLADFLILIVYVCLAYGINALIIIPLLGLIFSMVGLGGTAIAAILTVIISILVLLRIANYLYMAATIIVESVKRLGLFVMGRA